MGAPVWLPVGHISVYEQPVRIDAWKHFLPFDSMCIFLTLSQVSFLKTRYYPRYKVIQPLHSKYVEMITLSNT